MSYNSYEEIVQYNFVCRDYLPGAISFSSVRLTDKFQTSESCHLLECKINLLPNESESKSESNEGKHTDIFIKNQSVGTARSVVLDCFHEHKQNQYVYLKKEADLSPTIL